MNRKKINRILLYLLGLVLLAVGLTFNTKTDLGVSPLISLPYSVSQIWDLSFPAMVFLLYILFVALQFLLRRKNGQLWDLLLQIPLSIFFSLLLDIMDKGYNILAQRLGLPEETLIFRFSLLAAAVIITGIGTAMTVAMDLIPNPADGLAKAIGEATRRNLGTGKNILDLSCVAVTCAIGIIRTGGWPVGIGIGTVVAMICVGRCIAVFNRFFHDKMMSAIEDEPIKEQL